MKRAGNPFVDMGLCTIAALAEKNSIEEISVDDIKNVFKKYDISLINSKLKSFTMVFGTNGPLYQNSYKPHNKKLYENILREFLNSVNEDGTGKHICEICGRKHDFDINDVWTDVIKKYGFKIKERKYAGRDFFPLIGSIGNDAQALPSASRTVDICPLCLFAVNYIPLGTMLIKGRLICVESTSEVLMMELVKQLVAENLSRVSLGNGEIYGKKEGAAEIYVRLLSIFTNLQRIKKYEKLPETAAIYIWLFSNSGTGADCDMIEIPNKSLEFIWQMAKKSTDFKNEFLALVNGDKGGRLFDCINYGWDYEGLYPFKKFKGVSPQFYEYYEKLVVGRNVEGLRFAQKIACEMLKDKEPKEIAKLQKNDLFKELSAKSIAKKVIADMVNEGRASYSDYLNLFGKEDKHLYVNENEAFKIIMYYLYNSNYKPERGDEIMDLKVKSQKTDERIRTFAELYFKYYVLDKEKGLGRGIERFKKDIIDKFKNYKEDWLKDNFVRMAAIYECNQMKLDYDGWLEFITDDEGNKRIYELMFQLRLAFANLYYEYLKGDVDNE